MEQKECQVTNNVNMVDYYVVFINDDPNYSVPIGKISQNSNDIAKNVESVLAPALGYITCWDNLGFEHVS